MVSGIRAMRLTHTGEDGFILYVPSEVSRQVLILVVLLMLALNILMLYSVD